MEVYEIQDLASRYVEKADMILIPDVGDIFYMEHRELQDNKVLKDDEGWHFGGYAQLLSYEKDPTAVPLGKWITMRFLSLAAFPAQVSEIKLQPPHITLGKFQSPDRTIETRIVTLVVDLDLDKNQDDEEAEIIEFKKK